MVEKNGKHESASGHGLVEVSNYSSRLSSTFREMRSKSDKLDVTLSCQDSPSNRTLQAHSILLSAFSPFFKTALNQMNSKTGFPYNSFLYLSSVSHKDLSLVLDFLYQGKINVPRANVKSFYKALEDLQIENEHAGSESTGSKNSPNKEEKRTPRKERINYREVSVPRTTPDIEEKKITKKETSVDNKREEEKDVKRKREPSRDSTSGYETHEEPLSKMSLLKNEAFSFSSGDLSFVGDLPLDDDSKDSLKLTDFDGASEKKEEKDRWMDMLPMNSDDEDDKAKPGENKANKGETDDTLKSKNTDPEKLSKECTSLLENELDSWKKLKSEDAGKPKDEDRDDSNTMNRKKSPKKLDVGLENILESNKSKTEVKDESSKKEEIDNEEEDNKDFVWPPKKDTTIATIFHDSFYLGKATGEQVDDETVKVSYMKRLEKGKNNYWIWPKERAILPAKKRSVLQVDIDLDITNMDNSEISGSPSTAYVLRKHETINDLAQKVSARNLAKTKKEQEETKEVSELEWPPEKGEMVATLFEDAFYIGRVKSGLNRNSTVDVDYMERYRTEGKNIEATEKLWVWPPKVEIFKTYEETVLGIKPIIRPIEKFGKAKAVFLLENYEKIYNLANSSRDAAEDDIVDV